jgi:FkbM family methyltransferase
LAGLRRVGIEPLAFADNNSILWGQKIEGLPVLSPQEASQKFASYAAFVVSIWGAGNNHRLEHTRRQLTELGCKKIVSFAPLFWKYAEIFLPYYSIDLPQALLPQRELIARAFDLWADESSRYEYLAQIRWRLRLDFDGLLSPVKHEQYFPDDLLQLSVDEIVVDCGAFDGDSIRSLLRRQPEFRGKIIAIEPDPTNFGSLYKYVASLTGDMRDRINLLPVAVGKDYGTVRFAATGQASSIVSSNGSLEVKTVPLDMILVDNSPTFIKMDIEGAEIDALIGAHRTVGKVSPALAICVYHQADHLWRIPLLIRSYSDQYKFYLRPHNEECWDLVCYAIPKTRLIAK